MNRKFDKLKLLLIIVMAALAVLPLPTGHEWNDAVPPAMVTGAGG